MKAYILTNDHLVETKRIRAGKPNFTKGKKLYEIEPGGGFHEGVIQDRT